ncbi:CYTH domain-containing protein [Balneatrix alpica]|uniref:CYTH domain-containing protein n=1 Tax=Balneatrix alpica TaxID=75684 RepID=UPI0027393E8C|nr:CYTH domain-containing protein [Balneatrix alpica]
MSKEIELKLSLVPEAIEQLEVHPLLQLAQYQGRKHLLNTYFDTPALHLQQQRIALRIRQRGPEDFVQTLKTQGSSLGGLSQRGEWEVPLAQPALQLELLPEGAWPVELKGIKQQLKPAFRTDFQRRQWLLEWQGSRIELVLDQGVIEVGEQQQPLCEVELELLQGQPETLLQLGRQLSDKVALQPCDISKAERGYRLFSQQWQPRLLPEPAWAGLSLEQAYQAQLQWLATRWGQQWQLYLYQPQWQQGQVLLQLLQQMQHTLEAFTPVLGLAPVSVLQPLRQGLSELQGALAWRELQQQWQLPDSHPLVQSGQQLVQQRLQELNLALWPGQLLLGLQSWLYSRGWQEQLSEEQHRLCQAPLLSSQALG